MPPVMVWRALFRHRLSLYVWAALPSAAPPCGEPADASAALSALRAELEQVKRERDAAYKLLGGEPPKTCKTCVLWGGNGWGQYQIGYCDGDDNPHGPNDFCSRHHGPQKEL